MEGKTMKLDVHFIFIEKLKRWDFLNANREGVDLVCRLCSLSWNHERNINFGALRRAERTNIPVLFRRGRKESNSVYHEKRKSSVKSVTKVAGVFERVGKEVVRQDPQVPKTWVTRIFFGARYCICRSFLPREYEHTDDSAIMVFAPPPHKACGHL